MDHVCPSFFGVLLRRFKDDICAKKSRTSRVQVNVTRPPLANMHPNILGLLEGMVYIQGCGGASF